MRTTRRTITRWTTRVAVLLALGLTTTVLVAWGLAAWLPHHGLVERSGDIDFDINIEHHSHYCLEVTTYERTGMSRRTWFILFAGGWPPYSSLIRDAIRTDASVQPGTIVARHYEDVSVPAWGTFTAALGSFQRGDHAAASQGTIEDARGWPALALWCSIPVPAPPRGALTPDRTGLVLVSADSFSSRVLPLRPIWPGLLKNTGFYAAAWAVLLLTGSGLRRALRRRRGGCPACGYDLRGLPALAPCPECGTPPTPPAPTFTARSRRPSARAGGTPENRRPA